MVIKARKIGRVELYKLNLNDTVKKLMDLDMDISKKIIKEDMDEQGFGLVSGLIIF